MSNEGSSSEFDGLLRLVRRKGAVVRLPGAPEIIPRKSASFVNAVEDRALFSSGARSLIGRMQTRLMTALTIFPERAEAPGRGIMEWLLLLAIKALQDVYDFFYTEDKSSPSFERLIDEESLPQPQACAAESLRVSQAGDRDALSDRILDAIIIFSPSDEKKEQLKEELRCMGPRALTIIANFGVKIVIPSSGQAYHRICVDNVPLVEKGLILLGKYDVESHIGLYVGEQRLLLVQESWVGAAGSESVAVHECAHAIDHAIQENHRLPVNLSLRLWNRFSGTRKALVSSYAGEDPREYFAESVMAYFSPAKRPVLIECDPQMFAFLTKLFAE
ncbi:MAG: hypothetical protein RDV48_25450 [Candidatus Eremiobacteraeota bacterium]|nr:hypothetical protein [Candidatus Eremiobacteraeota bacterium]